jgi:5-methylcytosine-specific restriction endonuclease McrBC regulatory subunit McrC
MTSESLREKLAALSKEELIDLFIKLTHQNDTVEAYLMNHLFGSKDHFTIIQKKIEKIMSNHFGEYQKAFKLFDTYIKSSANPAHSLELSCDFMEWLMEEADTYSETFPDTLLEILTYVYEVGVVLAAEAKDDKQTKRLFDVLALNHFDEDVKEVLSGIYYDYLNESDDDSHVE